MDLTDISLDDARALVNGPLWPKVRDDFRATGVFQVYPLDDPRRFAYLDDDVRRDIDRWVEALSHVDEWRTVVDGPTVRRLKADYPGVYPEVLRYAAYCTGGKDARRQIMKLKFPEAYALCCS